MSNDERNTYYMIGLFIAFVLLVVSGAIYGAISGLLWLWGILT